MVYIRADGSLATQKKFTPFSFVSSIFRGIIDFFSLFFSSITGNPAHITVGANTNGNRRRNANQGSGSRLGGSGAGLGGNRVKGSNIRSVKNMGTAQVCNQSCIVGVIGKFVHAFEFYFLFRFKFSNWTRSLFLPLLFSTCTTLFHFSNLIYWLIKNPCSGGGWGR